MTMTINERLQGTGSRTTGFDYIRIALATSIILWHGISVSYGTVIEVIYWRGPLGVMMHFVLPMFFALSGFLVSGSIDRCRTLISFFGLRALRIIPALAVEITLSALLLGPILTAYPLGEYFTDQSFFAYFLNVIGEIHYTLPGLFEENPLRSTVNAQLWTVPFELQCYLAIGGLALSSALRKRQILLALVLLAQALWIWQALERGDNGGSGGASGPVLMIAFLSGILFYLYKDCIKLHWSLFFVAVIGGTMLSTLPNGAYYLPIPASYITIYIGLLNPRKISLVSRGDYSYELFLYGFPLQQAVASYGPGTHHWWINVGVSLPAALLIAIASWHFIERPALSLRRLLPAIEARLCLLAIRRPNIFVHIANVDRIILLKNILTVCIVLGGLSGALLFVNANTLLASIAVLGSFFAALLRAHLNYLLEFLSNSNTNLI